MTTLIKIGLFALSAICVGGCEGKYFFNFGSYARAHLDPKGPTMTVSGYFAMDEASRRHFFRFKTQFGNEISDCDARVRNSPQACYNLFNVDHAGKVLGRTKYLEIMRAPFGTIYSHVHYEYRPDVKMADRETPVRFPNVVTTFVHRNSDLRYVPAQERAGFAPTDKPLSAISTVRVFQSNGKTFAVSANYSKDGHRYQITADDGSTLIGSGGNNQAVEFGIPDNFPIADYLRMPTNPFLATAADVRQDVVILHYDESYEVRRDVLFPGRPVISTFLVFPQTHEDVMLRSIDGTRDFAEIDHTRGPRLEVPH
jgi:hypothetical protein